MEEDMESVLLDLVTRDLYQEALMDRFRQNPQDALFTNQVGTTALLFALQQCYVNRSGRVRSDSCRRNGSFLSKTSFATKQSRPHAIVCMYGITFRHRREVAVIALVLMLIQAFPDEVSMEDPLRNRTTPFHLACRANADFQVRSEPCLK